ncbi:hypothetical protein M514_02927 [Trichuris suis]|uniref:Uncharacterized protein n=1 Tax=Trichuris suis TaxID=68888 RepID=A0A085NB28_9BILA|nr:hypothetical protein M513_02927 [Trichuris suis]KFD66674.1 hypothetical protein M514_02927 [Trichuris suis]
MIVGESWDSCYLPDPAKVQCMRWSLDGGVASEYVIMTETLKIAGSFGSHALCGIMSLSDSELLYSGLKGKMTEAHCA